MMTKLQNRIGLQTLLATAAALLVIFGTCVADASDSIGTSGFTSPGSEHATTKNYNVFHHGKGKKGPKMLHSTHPTQAAADNQAAALRSEGYIEVVVVVVVVKV